MAKTIMIADAVYADLKNIKEREDKSYSEVISEFLNSQKSKTIGDLLKFKGIPNDKEYDEVMRDVKKMWARWTKRYA